MSRILSREDCANFVNEWEYDIDNACSRKHRDCDPFVTEEMIPEFILYYAPHKQHLRYGQAFCNHFDIHDDELYYCRDDQAAQEIVEKHYFVG